MMQRKLCLAEAPRYIMSMHRPESLPRQPCDAVVDVANWAQDEDFPVYPVGSKPKYLLISPKVSGHPFLVGDQGYLFKTANGRWEQQLWAEVLAYELSWILGVTVPPAFVALNSATGEVGVLIEIFYRYPNPNAKLVHAADFMQSHFTDNKRGRPHAIRWNLALSRKMDVQSFDTWWARTLIFDTLIGNTDRHAENWGFLIEGDRKSLAPLYDNGTSLGYNILDQKLSNFKAANTLARFVSKGEHHCGWSLHPDLRMGHIALCQRFFTTYPRLKPIAVGMLNFEGQEVEQVVNWAQDFDLTVPFTVERAAFVIDQIATRRSMLLETLEL